MEWKEGMLISPMEWKGGHLNSHMEWKEGIFILTWNGKEAISILTKVPSLLFPEVPIAFFFLKAIHWQPRV